jgi:simple sugar transport system permease protein
MHDTRSAARSAKEYRVSRYSGCADDPATGHAGGWAAGALLAAVLGVLVIWLGANQYASGLAISLLGAGLSAFAGAGYVQTRLPVRSGFAIAGLADLPLIGPALFGQHPLVYGTVLLALGLTWFFARTRAGLALRAVGEAPQAAHALGWPVRRIRLAALLCGGALCGLAGAYLSIVYTPLWAEGMVAGRGWIALALTAFATWRPMRVLAGAYLFGGVTLLQLHLQGQGVHWPSQFLSMLPYLAVIAALALIARNPAWIRANMPASLGQPFHPHDGGNC